MFFTDKEKAIYESPSGAKYDPLAVNNQLTVITDGKLNDLIHDHNAFGDESAKDAEAVEAGLSPQSDRVRTAAVITAAADLKLARVAREAFGLPEFPDCTDGTALETLFHFMEWLEGKDSPGETRHSSPSTSPGVLSREPLTNTSPCT